MGTVHKIVTLNNSGIHFISDFLRSTTQNAAERVLLFLPCRWKSLLLIKSFYMKVIWSELLSRAAGVFFEGSFLVVRSRSYL